MNICTNDILYRWQTSGWRRFFGSLAVGVFVVATLCAVAVADEVPSKSRPIADPAVIEFFETHVRPVLAEYCYECHGPESDHEAGLRVDTLSSLLVGGDTGPAIVPGKPEESLLIDTINYGDIYQMPPDSKLSAEKIAALTKWVQIGAPWPGDQGVDAHNVEDRKQDYKYTEQDRSHWAFQPPIEPPVPPVKKSSWPKTPIDQFVLEQLEANGLTPAPPADKRTLIRRATYDLHGLPPTPEEVQSFLEDDAPEAFRRVVDRLLESPRYGERWGRHWLDIARYADSNGSDNNRLHANGYRYRDYVVSAFNDDLPFDRFVLEQLAGDLLPYDSREERNRLWIATGFLALGPKPLLMNDVPLAEMDVVDEQIRTVSSAFMSLTFGCSRCHNHKFDPLPMTDYYALAGIFKSTKVIDDYDILIHRSWTERALGSEEEVRRHRYMKREHDRVNDLRRLITDMKIKEVHIAEMAVVRTKLADIPVAVSVRKGDVADCAVHLRGNPQTKGKIVPRRFPVILAGLSQPPIPEENSGRLELAQWLTSDDHPLTSRVIANRIWKWHFGEGIVRSTDNFGTQGQKPDNQPLLDWLAVRFTKLGWSFKSMHRLMMLSSTYQMSSQNNEETWNADPENRFLWRFPLRRLSAEEIRDAMLLISGELDDASGGPVLPGSINYELADFKSHVRKQIRKAYDTRRRSIYLPVIRSGLFNLFSVFDFADPSIVTGSRGSTTVAPQALFMLNSDFVSEMTGATASALLKQTTQSDDQRIEQIYEKALCRSPSQKEIQRAKQFLKQYDNLTIAQGSAQPASQKAAWQAFCRVIFSSNEFIYLQ